MGLVANDDGFDFVPLEDQDEDEAGDKPAAPAEPETEADESDEDRTGVGRQYLEAIEALRPHVEETQRQLALLEAESNATMLARRREALRRDIEASFTAIPERGLPTPQIQRAVAELHIHLRDLYHLEEGHHLPLTAAALPAGLVIPTLLVTGPESGTAPIVHAQSVTLSGLFGRVVAGSGEGRYPEPGTILAGDVHRANGGFLIIDAEALIKRERVYEHLKACLLARSIQPWEDSEGPPSPRVQPIDLDLKVVLVADADLISQLQDLDPEFTRLSRSAPTSPTTCRSRRACRSIPASRAGSRPTAGCRAAQAAAKRRAFQPSRASHLDEEHRFGVRQKEAESAARRGRCADPDRDADPAHARDVAGRPARLFGDRHRTAETPGDQDLRQPFF